jgi:general secretion pathway protein G
VICYKKVTVSRLPSTIFLHEVWSKSSLSGRAGEAGLHAQPECWLWRLSEAKRAMQVRQPRKRGVDLTFGCLHCDYMKSWSARSTEHGARGLIPPFHRTSCGGAGFTLIELLVVVAVIAILAGITLAALGGLNQKGARDRTKAEIAGIVNALERYKSQNDTYPPASGSNLPYAAISAFMPQLTSDAVVTNLTDPYGSTYLYRFPGTRNMATFDVWSAGQDTSSSATNDDIGNW